MLGARQMWTKEWWTKILFTALSSLTLPSGTHRPRGTRCCFSKYLLHPGFLCSHMGPFIQIESAPPAEPFSPRPANDPKHYLGLLQTNHNFNSCSTRRNFNVWIWVDIYSWLFCKYYAAEHGRGAGRGAYLRTPRHPVRLSFNFCPPLPVWVLLPPLDLHPRAMGLGNYLRP